MTTINFGENLRSLRHGRKLTQEALAGYLGVTFQCISNWERGESYPDITLLPAIAAFFDVSVDALLGADTICDEEKINDLINLYDTAKIKDLPLLFENFRQAMKRFPGNYSVMVRYMQLLQEVKIRSLSLEEIRSGEYKAASEEIDMIYRRIQKHCTADSIRIWSKTIMITHLLWKFDCLSSGGSNSSDGEDYILQAKEIINTLPGICNCREIMAVDREDYYKVHKKALEELLYFLHSELQGYCLDYSDEKRLVQYKSLQQLLDLVYTDGDYCKNSYNRLYNLGHMGYLCHKTGDNIKALSHLKQAAEYAKELDRSGEPAEKAKRFYNYGTIYREATAAQFMKIVMTEHYPLSESFKSKKEFRDIIELLDKEEA